MLIVPIDDKKSINKKFVLQKSKLLKKHFNVPFSSFNDSINNSNRVFEIRSNKFIKPISHRFLYSNSNRSISNFGQNKLEKFKLLEDEEKEPNFSVSNPFTSSKIESDLDDSYKRITSNFEEIRDRRNTSGLILKNTISQPPEEYEV